MFSLLSIILAILALSFLIFIHELGHYWMARRSGMRVDTFSIGFGKPLYSWKRGDTTWQIGWLLFGGYVKIAGTDLESSEDPYSVPGGFFASRPIDRIKVAFMGPLVNLIFALLVFALLWGMGGRTKTFEEFTHKIGWVDTESELFRKGVRPGDEITAYGDRELRNRMDHRRIPMTEASPIRVQGLEVDYLTGKKKPFAYQVKIYPDPNDYRDEVVTTGVLDSAQYLIYDTLPGGNENPLLEGSPMEESGIQAGDRLVWMDGELLFSQVQLSRMINDRRALLTIERDGKTMLRRVPRVQALELRPDAEFREELIDWQHDADLADKKYLDLYTIPYNLNPDLTVENKLRFVDIDSQREAFPPIPYSDLESPLEPGDRILAIEGKPVKQAPEFLSALQENFVNIIVKRAGEKKEPLFWYNADQQFDKELDLQSLEKIAASIGTENLISLQGDLVLLKPVKPKLQNELLSSPESKAMLTTDFMEKKKRIETIEDPEKKAWALNQLDKQQKRLMLGIYLQDETVRYNPNPVAQFFQVFDEVWSNLSALVTGMISPKYFVGPVGIVQQVQYSSMVSIKEAIFWIGVISLNLGILNLLPIPVLDGGTIAISLYELVTGRRVHPKVLEKMILPFAILLIGFFIYLTYNDLIRVFGSAFIG